MLEDFFEDFTKMVETSADNDLGGSTSSLSDGEEFRAGIFQNKTSRVIVATSEKIAVDYTIVARKTTVLGFNDIVKRNGDNALFRVTSDCADMETPSVADEQYWQVTVERIKPEVVR